MVPRPLYGDLTDSICAKPAQAMKALLKPMHSKKGSLLGPPVVPFKPFLVEGSPTQIDYRKKGTLILTSLLEDLASNDTPSLE